MVPNSVINLVMECLKDISDIEHQKQIGLEYFPYNEIACQLFDDTGVDDILKFSKYFFISEKVDNLLLELSILFDSIDSKIGFEYIINTDQWNRIVKIS